MTKTLFDMNQLFGTTPEERKATPIYSGCLAYFPRALGAVARLSYVGNQQHHPDKPLHWDKSKSTDELDALIRHLLEGEWDAVAWRALANLERELEKETTNEATQNRTH